MGSLQDVLAEQLAANRSSGDLWDVFASHRARLTELCANAAPPGGSGRLCVLGAGNANDLDLEALARCYRSIVLVDLDADALERAVQRQNAATRAVLVREAPVDVSGLLGRLQRWAAMQVTPEELVGHAEQTANGLRTRLGAPFDVVLSACLLTQMQLGLLTVLGERHQLFEAARFTLTQSHLRVLSALTAPGGRALFACDLTANDIAPAITNAAPESLPELVTELVAQGHVFQVANPELVREIARDDPKLAVELELMPSLATWLWRNGTSRTFLVYALEGRRRPESDP